MSVNCPVIVDGIILYVGGATRSFHGVIYGVNNSVGLQEVKLYLGYFNLS